jgi:hypothetical protein
MMVDKIKFATIVSIDENEKNQPLQLSNDDILYGFDQVGVKPREENSFPINPATKRPAVPFYPINQYLNFKLPRMSRNKEKFRK